MIVIVAIVFVLVSCLRIHGSAQSALIYVGNSSGKSALFAGHPRGSLARASRQARLYPQHHRFGFLLRVPSWISPATGVSPAAGCTTGCAKCGPCAGASNGACQNMSRLRSASQSSRAPARSDPCATPVWVGASESHRRRLGLPDLSFARLHRFLAGLWRPRRTKGLHRQGLLAAVRHFRVQIPGTCGSAWPARGIALRRRSDSH